MIKVFGCFFGKAAITIIDIKKITSLMNTENKTKRKMDDYSSNKAKKNCKLSQKMQIEKVKRFACFDLQVMLVIII